MDEKISVQVEKPKKKKTGRIVFWSCFILLGFAAVAFGLSRFVSNLGKTGAMPLDNMEKGSIESTYDALSPSSMNGMADGYAAAYEVEPYMPVPMPVYDDIIMPAPVNNEKYEEFDETGFSLTAVAPLSTFAADVDTASYANVRRMIQDGYTSIPEYAVRPEEFVNYFHYDLNKPDIDEVFGVTLQGGVCPWNENHELLMIGLQTEPIDMSDVGPSNFVFLLDVSGSMASQDKLPLLQSAMIDFLDTLRPDDIVSIVTYASGETVVLDGANVEDNRDEIISAINSLYASGSTAGERGIQQAYAIAEKHLIRGGNNRVIMGTDGDLNVGISEPDELEKLIKQKARSGVYLSVLGFGTGNIRDDNMQRLADCGNGNYSYIDSTMEARKVLVEEMGANMFTVADDVKFQVEFNPAYVNAYRLIGYENRRLADTDFRDDTKDAGEVGAGHSVVALYEIIPAGSKEAIDLKYGSNTELNTDDFADEVGTLRLRYKRPGELNAVEIECVVHVDVMKDEPNDDFRFAAAVTEFAQVLANSKNVGNGSLKHVYDVCKDLDFGDDEYRMEFQLLVKQAMSQIK